jgi:SHS2 domain-containing protein
VFAEAALALAELLGEGSGEELVRRVRLDAPDRAALLVEWLEELVFLCETEGLVPERVEELELGQTSLQATVAGHAATPRTLVKAITYHDLAFERRGGEWFARLVLDV